jgi:hypothetical protein
LATLSHANIPIQGHETCASFTQYCPGGLLWFVDNKFHTQKQVMVGSKKRKKELLAALAD